MQYVCSMVVFISLFFFNVEHNTNALLRKADSPVEGKPCIIMVTILFIFVCVIIAVFHYLDIKEIEKLKKQLKDVDRSLSEIKHNMDTIEGINNKLTLIANDVIFIKALAKDSKELNTTNHFDIIKHNNEIQRSVISYGNQIKEKIEKLSKENISLSDAILKTIDDKCLTFKPNTKSNAKRNNSNKPKASKSKAKNSYDDLNVTDNAQESK